MHDIENAVKSLSGKGLSDVEKVNAFCQLMASGRVTNLAPVLPLLFNLRGKPFTLKDHFPFETMFQVRSPLQSVVKAARQVGKSQTIAVNAVLRCAAIAYYSVLYVAPRFEQSKRESTQYVRPLIDQSPIKQLLMGTTVDASVLQRSFSNLSKIFFSFALTDADRIRGLAIDNLLIDEVQNISIDLLPVIKEVLSASQWRLTQYSGTALTLDNTLESLWQSSSQAEWLIVCPACNYSNIPAKAFDIDKMIGPDREDISEHAPGVVCAKCQRPINPRTGRWLHSRPERRWDFFGMHIPQIIMPMHYAKRDRWKTLLGKREGKDNTSPANFDNEVLGESCDQGIKLVTKTDLMNAAILPWKNDPLCRNEPTEALRHLDDYILRIMGVDWGSGLKAETVSSGERQAVSLTKYCVLGVRPDGKFDVIYGRQLLNPADQISEGISILQDYQKFRCHFCAHDNCGSGAVREALMVHMGLPIEQLVPFVYCSSKSLISFHKSEVKNSRNYWLLDKARSLVNTCTLLKFQYIRTFAYDYVDSDEVGLLDDFLALTENKMESARGRDVYTIVRAVGRSDDYAHSVNFAVCAACHIKGSWPDLAEVANTKISESQMQMLSPQHYGPSDDGMAGFFGIQ
jgi:hypothetical protein